jgi:hypothetical protein
MIEFKFFRGIKNDIWNGWISHIESEIDICTIYCTLRKDYQLDQELSFPPEILSNRQKDLVSVGQVIRFNMDTEVLEFLLADGTWV